MADEFLIYPRWLVPVEPAGTVLRDHAVAVRDGKIEAVLPAAQARARFASWEEVVLENHILIPGLVNAHARAALSLLRGAQERVAAAQAKHLSTEFVRDGTQLACEEMALGGVTCFNNNYFFPEAALQAALALGMRSAHGLLVMAPASAYASDAQDYIRKGLDLRDRYRDHPLVSFTLAPDGVTDEVLATLSTLAAELDIPMHVRLQGAGGEIERLRRLGLLGPGLIAAHAVGLDAGEIEQVAAHGCSIAHCPSSELRLAGGVAPVAAMSRAGINVALGTDGADSSSRLDMFQEMRTAALLAREAVPGAQAFPAQAALHAATLAGARALGIERTIGSIVPGKAADLTAVNMRGRHLVPCYDPLSHLVCAAGREDVSHVWVAGKPLVSGGILQKEAFPGLDTRIQLWQNALAAGS